MKLRLVELDASALPDPMTCAAGFNGDVAGAREALDATFAILTEHPRPSPWGSYLAWRGSEPIGLCAFKFAPDAAGDVEIAYFTFPAFEGQGIATEMAAALVEIAASSGATTVAAHTLPETNASTRILTRLGFQYLGEVDDPEDGIVWRWRRPASAL